MKLKSVVASMLALGVASTAALAAGSNTVNDAMKDQVAKMEAVLNQHQAGLNSQVSTDTSSWFNRITVSGGFDVDAYVSAKNSFRFQNDGGQTNAFELSNANLFVDAQVNDWVKAHAGLHFDQNVNRDGLVNFQQALYENEKNKWLDEAYVTIANFAQSPAYVRVGREFVPFGSYDAHAITPSLTQMLTQTRATALQAGVVMANGFNAAAYTFNGTDKKDADKNRRVNNFGLNVGYANSYNNVDYKASVGYLYNMADVNYIAAGRQYDNVKNVAGGISVDGSVKAGAFDASAHYVTALKSFAKRDVSYIDGSHLKGAKPSAWGVDAGYSFAIAGRDSRLGLGYQRSSQTNNVGPDIFLGLMNYGMPQQRYVAQYDVNVWKNTDLGLQVYHDRDFDDNQGTGNKNTTGLVRLSVKLA